MGASRRHTAILMAAAIAAAGSLHAAPPQAPTAARSTAQRPFAPADLFRYERVGAIAWTPDFARAAVELHGAHPWLDGNISAAAIGIVDAATARLRVVAAPVAPVLGYFGAAWAPDGRRLVFFSIDRDGRVRPWLWDARAAAAPVMLAGLEISDAPVDGPRALWVDPTHVIVMRRDPARPNSGPMYFAVTRGRNSGDELQIARNGREAAVSVFESQAPQPGAEGRFAKIVSLDVTTRKASTLAEGAVHAPRLSADHRTLTYRVETPAIPAAPASSFFGPEAVGDAAYDRANWGNEIRYVDARTGAPVAAPAPATAPPASSSRTDVPSLRVVNAPETGTTLVLARPGRADVVVWRGNAWIRDIATGRAEAIAYTGDGGRRLTGWLLYPPGYRTGQSSRS